MENRVQASEADGVRTRLAPILQETFVYLPADIAARLIEEQERFDALFPGNRVTFLRDLWDALPEYNVAV